MIGDAERALMGRVKAADPNGILNPGKGLTWSTSPCAKVKTSVQVRFRCLRLSEWMPDLRTADLNADGAPRRRHERRGSPLRARPALGVGGATPRQPTRAPRAGTRRRRCAASRVAPPGRPTCAPRRGRRRPRHRARGRVAPRPLGTSAGSRAGGHRRPPLSGPAPRTSPRTVLGVTWVRLRGAPRTRRRRRSPRVR